MGKLKELWNGEHKSFYRYAFVVTVAFVIFICFLTQDNVVRYVQARIEIRKQQKQIEFYQKEIEDMDRRIRMISNNKDSLETFARENFNFASPGEEVYLDPK